MAESSAPANASNMDVAALQAILGTVLADWVKALDLRVLEARTGEVALALPVTPLQVHGGGGVSEDFPLANNYALARTLRFADGPDEVHRNAIAKIELGRHA